MSTGARRCGKAGVTASQWKLHDVERDFVLEREKSCGEKGCERLRSRDTRIGSCDASRRSHDAQTQREILQPEELRVASRIATEPGPRHLSPWPTH